MIKFPQFNQTKIYIIIVIIVTSKSCNFLFEFSGSIISKIVIKGPTIIWFNPRELKFGTKRKNRKLRPISRTSWVESNHSGYRSLACTSNFQWNFTRNYVYRPFKHEFHDAIVLKLFLYFKIKVKNNMLIVYMYHCRLE